MNNTTEKTAHDFRLFSSFDRESRVDKYKANNIDESIIDAINNNLANVDQLIREIKSDKVYPPIIITGVPRSGTTLISQLLPARYDLGYVSNLMARFYEAPLTGAWLQQKLIPKDIHLLRDFSSHHGVTGRVYEPHEFGYFWARYLRFGSNCHEPVNKKELESINFSALNRVLLDLTGVFNRPTVYKCAIAPFILDSFMNHTNVFVIHIVRDRLSTINSILNVRKQRLGSEKEWWSIRPYGWDKLCDKAPEEQVAWQYDRVNEAIVKRSTGYEKKLFRVELEEILKCPEIVLEDIMCAYAEYSGISQPKVGLPINALSE